MSGKPDKPKAKPSHSGRRGDPVSLAPLTPDQALAAALRVKKGDVDKLEQRDKEGKAKKKRRNEGKADNAQDGGQQG